MKIAFLSFYSGVVSRGVETFVHELSNGLVNLGHDVTVYQVGKELANAKYKTISIPIDVDWENSGSYTTFLNYYSLKIKKFTHMVLKVIDKDTDIIFPTGSQWQSVLCSIWAKWNKKKIIIAGQSGPGLDDRISILTFPNRFVGLTNFQKEWANRVNPLVKSVKIPNGVSLEDFKFQGSKLDLKMERPVILCVSALSDWKRLDLVIKAVSRLKKGSLLLVGSGSQKNRLQELGDQLLPGRFKIMNFTHNEMPKVYRSADIFTFATVPWESFGIVLVEAMASGLPIVASDDPIRREIVDNAGFFVDPSNTKEFASLLEKALNINWKDSQSLTKLGLGEPRKQAEKFSWLKIAEQYEKLFNSL